MLGEKSLVLCLQRSQQLHLVSKIGQFLAAGGTPGYLGDLKKRTDPNL